MWRIGFLVLAVGCTDHGETPPGGASREVGPFEVQLCTAGAPGDPTCPINAVPLDSIGAPAGTFLFVLQALGSSVLVTSPSLDPGVKALHVVRPQFLIVQADGTPAALGGIDGFDMVVDAPTQLPGAAFVGVDVPAQMILRFEIFQPL